MGNRSELDMPDTPKSPDMCGAKEANAGLTGSNEHCRAVNHVFVGVGAGGVLKRMRYVGAGVARCAVTKNAF
eukprot:13359342-Alexandrium_andersonii.AAC.1